MHVQGRQGKHIGDAKTCKAMRKVAYISWKSSLSLSLCTVPVYVNSPRP